MKLDGRWTIEKITTLLDVVQPLVYRRKVELPFFKLHILEGEEDDPFAAAGSGSEIKPGELWGPPRTNFVLISSFRVPEDWGSPAALFLPFGDAGDFSHPEALVYIDGEAWASSDRHHQEIHLGSRWMDGKEHELMLHGWTGGVELPPVWSEVGGANRIRLLQMRACQLVELDQPARDLYYLASAALGVAKTLDLQRTERASLLHALMDAFQVLDTRNPLGDSFYNSVPEALQVLKEGIRQSGAALDVDITAVGHAHIDVAWLWTLQQARYKTRRSFSNVLRLMEEYPEFTFVQSQAQLYDYMRRDAPEQFSQIQQLAREGRWEPVGGMWVESDCNITGPESLVRQFLLGRAFFEAYFGETHSRVLWLPDVFGFCWNLPQLAKEAGLDYMFTIKLGWNEYNRLPFESFWWQGLDGSRLLTHFSPVRWSNSGFSGTYNANVTPEEVVGSWDNTVQKQAGGVGKNLPLLMSYGFGDGGGGPTRRMLENIRLFSDFPGTPRVKCGSAETFFENLENDFGADLPVWNDELYLEYHRGTYTSQARTKQANRRAEFALHDAEFLSAAAKAVDSSYGLPLKELRRAWELECLNQFHDILPGSSIRQVYEVSAEQYKEIEMLASSASSEALEALASILGGDVLVVNPTGFSVSTPVLVSGLDGSETSLARPDGSSCAVQEVEEGVLVDTGSLEPYSIAPLSFSTGNGIDTAFELSISKSHLENSILRLEFSKEGDLVGIYDKSVQRDILVSGEIGNQLQLFEDRPAVPDAWDISIYYDDRMWLAEPAEHIEVIEEGPLRAALRIRRWIHNSVISQEIRLHRGSRRIDFNTTVDWRERNMMLKAAFPVDVLSPKATYEIQWGNIERPTHKNTSWDMARFEVPAQKWMDLSEGGYGVSLLNDSKYGCDIHERVLRLSLLRSPSYPDPEADEGVHHFCYSLFPHIGSLDRSTAAQAYALNDPLIGYVTETKVPEKSDKLSFFSLQDSNLILETVKPAEDGRGLILRMYDFKRQRGRGEVVCGFLVQKAWRTTILEEDQFELKVDGNEVGFLYKPYEIISIRIIPG